MWSGEDRFIRPSTSGVRFEMPKVMETESRTQFHSNVGIPDGSVKSNVADNVWTISFDIPSFGCKCEIRVGEDYALESRDVPGLCQSLDAS